MRLSVKSEFSTDNVLRVYKEVKRISTEELAREFEMSGTHATKLINGVRPISEELKPLIRKKYKDLSSYVNVRYKEERRLVNKFLSE